MTNKQLSLIANTAKKLDGINHPDALRVSKEICEFAKYSQSDVDQIVLRLSKNEPWEYIRGYTDFDGNIINVNRNTLIPRVETLQILEIFKEFKNVENVIDVGCGSGAIGISIAKRYPNLNITLVDISKEALEVAKKNVTLNHLKESVEVIENDMLSNIECKPNTLIIANLPYIPTQEYLKLDSSVMDFEPRVALDGGKEGVDLITRLIDQVVSNQNYIGAILEIDPSQEQILSNYLNNQDRFKFSLLNDFRGLLRFLKLYL